jgi:hypothetical protein
MMPKSLSHSIGCLYHMNSVYVMYSVSMYGGLLSVYHFLSLPLCGRQVVPVPHHSACGMYSVSLYGGLLSVDNFLSLSLCGRHVVPAPHHSARRWHVLGVDVRRAGAVWPLPAL